MRFGCQERRKEENIKKQKLSAIKEIDMQTESLVLYDFLKIDLPFIGALSRPC